MKWVAALGGGIAQDAQRLRWASWIDDWSTRGKLRILAAATYVCLASAIPALAFGVQASSDTDGLLTPVSVLAATAMTGVMQALVGGQPLLIVGVAEPIVLTYGYMYDFAKDREGLGRQRFLAWAAWCCVWAAAMIMLLALTNACVYIRHFTRLSGELFGMLIALLFLQQAIKGSVEEFRSSSSSSSDSWVGGTSASGNSSTGGSLNSSASGGLSAPPDAATWQLVNGIWSLLLALGLLLCALLLRSARVWRFLRAPARGFLADYGAPLVLLAFSGLSFAVHGGSGSWSVPRRVETPNVWDSSSNWTVAGDMAALEGRWIAAALIPAALITVLFFFDHNVSAQLAQQEEFNLKKPTAYHWDFLLLGFMTLLCGLLGLPPVNGVLPQAPMHTKALAKVAGKRRSGRGRSAQQAQQQGQQRQQEGSAPCLLSGMQPAAPAAGCVELGAAGGGGKSLNGTAAGFESPVPALRALGSRSRGLHLSPSAQALLPHAGGRDGSSSFAQLTTAVEVSGGSSSSGILTVDRGSLDAPPVAAREVLQAAGRMGKAGGGGAAGGAAGGAVAAAGAQRGTAGTASGAAGRAAGTAAGTADIPADGPADGAAGIESTAGAAAVAADAAGTADTAAGAAGVAEEEVEVVAVHVYEQRWSGLLQSLGVAAFLAATPAIRQIPTACLWGYFAFMALESLPGSQFWDRLLLLLTDPSKRAQLLERAHAPYLETVPFRVIAWFTAFQAAYLLLVYGVTWASVAGILFPLPIMALVPLRQWVLPRCFANRRHLQELDAATEEEAAPLTREQALQEAAAQGLAAGAGAPGGGRASEEGSAELEGTLPDSELHHLRVVHHLSRSSLIHRRSTVELGSDASEAAPAAGAAAAAAAAAATSSAATAAAAALPGGAYSPRAAAGLRRRSHELPHV